MSIDQKKTINIPVETVENYQKTLEHCLSTIEFFKLENKWPTNLIYDSLLEIQGTLGLYVRSVSRSHINDK